MMYHIINSPCGYVIAELGLDQMIRPLHENPMKSSDAAERLRKDLMDGTCPLDVEPSPSGDWNPIAEAAEAYDIAERICPILGKRKGAWNLAVKIAASRPWIEPPSTDWDDEIPF